MTSNILVVDDEAASRESLVDVLNDEGYETVAASGGAEAIGLLEANDFDLVITDLRMPEIDGVALLKQIRQLRPQTLVILMTAYASVETAVDALREGAHDYMIKPLVFEDALSKIARLLERRQLAWQIQHLRREVEERFDFDNLVGQSAAMKQIVGLIRKVAPTDSTVLITGESGVGKEVVARAVHRQSNRAERIFLPVNCGAIPENLLESQLFGHVRGAFTGAVTAQEGLFQRAKSGTIFLDEIGELPLGLQVKLLRVLEEREVLPVGATEPNFVDIRIIAATNRDLEESCASGEFREDLFYRLNVFGIDIPPLRERREDIPLLVDFLVRRHNKEMNRHFKGVENAAMKILVGAAWKGNVRELDNIIEHAMILGSGDWITVENLPARVAAAQGDDSFYPVADLKSASRMFERNHIENMLAESDGDKRAAAGKLGISLSSLYRKIEELGITSS
jgi:two-component system response regulator PilR (NtrC family)